MGIRHISTSGECDGTWSPEKYQGWFEWVQGFGPIHHSASVRGEKIWLGRSCHIFSAATSIRGSSGESFRQGPRQANIHSNRRLLSVVPLFSDIVYLIPSQLLTGIHHKGRVRRALGVDFHIRANGWRKLDMGTATCDGVQCTSNIVVG